jgi:hypothetical protein
LFFLAIDLLHLLGLCLLLCFIVPLLLLVDEVNFVLHFADLLRPAVLAVSLRWLVQELHNGEGLLWHTIVIEETVFLPWALVIKDLTVDLSDSRLSLALLWYLMFFLLLLRLVIGATAIRVRFVGVSQELVENVFGEGLLVVPR